VKRRRRLGAILGAVCCLLTPAQGSASGAERTEPPRSIPELQVLIESVLRDRGVPGASVSLATADETLLSTGIGYADLDEGVPMMRDHLVRVGSISKMFTALTLLQLQEEGRVRLKDPLRDHLSVNLWENPWEDGHPIRIEHLLEHTTGFDDLHLAEYAYRVPSRLPLGEALALHPDSRTSRWTPGTRAAYSNSGPAIAAHVAEKVGGTTFEELVRQKLFEPLEMREATFFKAAGSLATGYTDRGEAGGYWELLYRPSGALNASAEEMANLIQMLLGRGLFHGEQLLQEASIDRMERSETTTAARAGLVGGYGLANMTSHHEGALFRGHSGSVDTFVADLGYSRDVGRGYFFAINRPDDEAFLQIRDLIRSFLLSDWARPARESPAQESELAKLAGIYRPVAPRIEKMRGPLGLFALQRVSVKGAALSVRPLFGGDGRRLLEVRQNFFREADHAFATVAFLESATAGTAAERDMASNGGMEIHATSGQLQGVHRRVASASLTVLSIAFGLLALLAIYSPLVVLPLRLLLRSLPRGWFGRLRPRRVEPHPIRMLLLSFLPALCFGWMALSLLGGFVDPLTRLATPSFWSIGFALSGPLAGLSAVVVGGSAVRNRAESGRWTLVYSGLVAVLSLGVVGVLGSWGLLGLRLWSY